jgi:hypothetical protein
MKPLDLQEEHRDEPIEQLERRLAEIRLRLTAELGELLYSIRDLKIAAVADRELRREIADHERRIRELEARST